jgi:hypothetical protein
MTEKQAKALRDVLVQGGTSLSDAVISTAPMACRRMKYDGSLIQNGTRIYWPEDGKIYKNGSDLWDREEFNPKNSPELWSEILYRLGIRVIPPKIEVSTKFSKDEMSWWGDTLCRSKVDNNVYTPEEYPDNWDILE